MNETPLRNMRKQRNKTLAKVAGEIGLDPANLSRIERGEQQASAEIAEKLSKFYDESITEIQILYPERFIQKSAPDIPESA